MLVRINTFVYFIAIPLITALESDLIGLTSFSTFDGLAYSNPK